MNKLEELTESNDAEEGAIEIYGYENHATKDAKVPKWLHWSYVLLHIWGIFALYYYFNGSHGWLDRGYWNQLQKAALTTFPSGTIEGEAEKTDKV